MESIYIVIFRKKNSSNEVEPEAKGCTRADVRPMEWLGVGHAMVPISWPTCPRSMSFTHILTIPEKKMAKILDPFNDRKVPETQKQAN
jgi:hypothetical protein